MALESDSYVPTAVRGARDAWLKGISQRGEREGGGGRRTCAREREKAETDFTHVTLTDTEVGAYPLPHPWSIIVCAWCTWWQLAPGSFPRGIYGLILFSLFFFASLYRFGTPPATSYEYSNNYNACYLYKRQRGAYMHDCACALRRTRVSAPDMRKRARGHARQPCASS